MPEGRYPRREPGELRPTSPPPCASDVSDKEARDENRRLKEKIDHGLHPIIPPRLLHRPEWGKMMIEVLKTCPVC
jgi:hypothetical protein